MHVGRPTRVPAATAALSAAGGRGRWDSHPTPGGDTRPSGHTSPLAQGPYGSPLGVSLLEQAARGGALATMERPRGSIRHAGASQGHTVGHGRVQGLESAALPQVAKEGRAAREPTRRTTSMGRQKHKRYKIRLQEYEGNADKKVSFYSFYKVIM